MLKGNKKSIPLISVIMPTYNRAHLLPRAIKSILNQTYQNLELIIVNDGSTDNTEEVIKSFDDNRIIYHKHEKNRGTLAAANTGYDLAKGKYQCAIGDDDELVTEAIETAVSKLLELSSEGTKVIRFDCINVETGELSGVGISVEGYMSYEDCLCGRISGDYFTMWDSEWLGESRFDEKLVGHEGMMWLRLHRTSKIYYVPKVLYRAYRLHGGERVSDYSYPLKHLPATILSLQTFMKEFGEEMKNSCPKYYGQRLAPLGYMQILNGNKVIGRRSLRESLKFSFSVRFCLVYCLSFFLTANQMWVLQHAYVRCVDMWKTTNSLRRFRKISTPN